MLIRLERVRSQVQILRIINAFYGLLKHRQLLTCSRRFFVLLQFWAYKISIKLLSFKLMLRALPFEQFLCKIDILLPTLPRSSPTNHFISNQERELLQSNLMFTSEVLIYLLNRQFFFSFLFFIKLTKRISVRLVFVKLILNVFILKIN